MNSGEMHQLCSPAPFPFLSASRFLELAVLPKPALFTSTSMSKPRGRGRDDAAGRAGRQIGNDNVRLDAVGFPLPS
jgi:hypothetical protein